MTSSEPRPASALSDGVVRYFELAPHSDTEVYFAQFTDDAVVEDEGTTRRGIDAIRAWRTSVPRVSYTVADVTDVAEAACSYRATVDVAGDFPGSPVRLSFHFEFAPDGRIASLAIRP